MPMEKPQHPGFSVRHDCIEPAGLTVTEAARRLGVSRKQLSEVVNGRAGISPEMAIRLERVFGGDAQSWLRRQAAYDLAQARMHDQTITTGDPRQDQDSVADKLEVDAEAVAAFCKRNHIDRLAFFGSVIRSDFGPESDVDVLVEFDPKHVPGLLGIARMEREFSEFVGGRRVDFRTPGDLSRHFRAQVLREAEVQYGR